MKRSLKNLLAVLSFTAFASSCNQIGSSTSKGSVTTGLTMTGSGQPAIAFTNTQKFFSFLIPSAVALTPPALVDSTSLNVNLNEAWVVIKEIEFESQEVPGTSEEDGDEVEFSGPFFVDLLTDAPISFGEAVIPASGIRRVKMKLHEAETLPASVPIELTSKSMYLSGTVNGVAFSYAADDSTELEIGGPNAVLPNSAQDMLIVIRIADLFKKINLSSITVSTDITASNRVNVTNPCPLIDSSATNLYTCFRKGFSTEGDFGNDDGDKDLDTNDDSVK